MRRLAVPQRLKRLLCSFIEIPLLLCGASSCPGLCSAKSNCLGFSELGSLSSTRIVFYAWVFYLLCTEVRILFPSNRTSSQKDDAGKIIPESGFLFMGSKNEFREHPGSKQASKVFIKGKQTAPRAAGSGEKSPLSLLSYRVFYSWKLGGGYQRGVQRDVVFSHWPYSITYISPCPIGLLGLEMSFKFYGFFVLLFP